MNKQHGFTLIEIIIVIVIIGVLSTLALPKVTGQIEASKAAEVMNAFGAYRRAANDCATIASGNTTSCVSAASLGVSMPSGTLGAAFTYSARSTGAPSPTGSIDFKAIRSVNGVVNAICMSVPFNGTTNTAGQVSFGVAPAGSIFAGVVMRANSSTGATIAACDEVSYANILN